MVDGRIGTTHDAGKVILRQLIWRAGELWVTTHGGGTNVGGYRRVVVRRRHDDFIGDFAGADHAGGK